MRVLYYLIYLEFFETLLDAFRVTREDLERSNTTLHDGRAHRRGRAHHSQVLQRLGRRARYCLLSRRTTQQGQFSRKRVSCARCCCCRCCSSCGSFLWVVFVYSLATSSRPDHSFRALRRYLVLVLAGTWLWHIVRVRVDIVLLLESITRAREVVRMSVAVFRQQSILFIVFVNL